MSWVSKQIEQEDRNIENIKNIKLIEEISGRYSLYGHSGGNNINITEAKLLDEKTLVVHFTNYKHICKHDDHGNVMYQTVFEGDVKFSDIVKKVKKKRKKNSLIALEVRKKDKKGLIHVSLHMSSIMLVFKCREIECTNYYCVDDKLKPVASLHL